MRKLLLILIFSIIGGKMDNLNCKTLFKYENEINVDEEKWESDFFPLKEFNFYRLTFTSKSPSKNYWAIIFYDKNKNQLIADNYSSFDASDDFTENTFYFRGKCNAKYGKIIFQKTGKDKAPFKIKSISVNIAGEKEILRWMENLYKKIPEVKKFEIKKKYIPQTMKKLKNGEKLRIVMLGDSIINDIGNSFFDILIKKKYPKAKIEVITSVRGSTGCWYYQEENRVQEYVLNYKPDLLIIGGISNRDNTEAIRNVIKKVREEQNPEIILMSKAVGKEGDPRINPSWTFEIPDDENSYRYRLKKLAEEEKTEFFDIEAYWGEYIRNSNLPYEVFLRDPVHANEIGRIVLAHLLYFYFCGNDIED